jgi:Delta7-sterol 5-desaturase
MILTWLTTSIGLFFIVFLRYVFFAGGFYVLCWKWKREKWSYKRIRSDFPDPKIVKGEFIWSVWTSVIFATTGAIVFMAWEAGHTLLYTDISKYGWTYFFFSIALLAFIHDTYFYWTHRLIHHPALFGPIHKVHHLSFNPSPWAAFSFHPYEALIEAIILPALAFVIPVHFAAFLIFLMMMTVLGVINHCGYELYPRNFHRHWFFRYWISATHHDQHHKWGRDNYGLYFNIWDRWMGTHNKNYEKAYDLLMAKRAP